MMRQEFFQTIFFMVMLTFFLTWPVSAYSREAVTLYDTGHALIASGNYTDAVLAFDHATAIEPGYFEAWNEKADALNRAKQYNDALEASDQAVLINPNYVQGWINRGYILYNLGRYDDELKAYERAIEIDPTSAEAWFNRGYALAAMSWYDEAIQSFDRVAELNYSYPNLQANRHIAEKNRDASTPFIVKYAPWLTLFCFFIIGFSWWIHRKRKNT